MTSPSGNGLTLAVTMLALLPPFLSFAVITVFTRNRRRMSAVISIGAVTVSMLSALLLLCRFPHPGNPIQHTARWLVAGDFTLSFGFLLDPTSQFMFALVGVICFLVQVYSLGYMSEDPGFTRYYAFQSLFAWSMLSLTVSASLLQLYVFWELVGLSSYLLIGFWYEKFSATQAGKKAFVMTRLGDVAFFLGLLLLLIHLGDVNILKINGAETARALSPALLTLSALLVFGGIVGKSAQFPLLTWLPDAMEGPTPVSALLHSATMVAAGVYLFARLFPFFSHSPDAMSVCLAIGTLSMLMASTMAMVDRDIKKVWAYSTISQLGYMLMGLSAGSYFAGTFHLITHATFKALLFLCSGVWIHYFETNDMYEIARKRGRTLKIPMACTVLAAASLAGLPPMSGFFSKEVIISALFDLENPVWLLAALLGIFMTAYYAFRPIFIILFPRESDSGDIKVQKKGPYRAMAWPLLVLAALTLLLGFFESTIKNYVQAKMPEEHGWLLGVSVCLGLLGVALTWLEFGRKTAPQIGFVERVAPVKRFFLERWFLDRFYSWFVKNIVHRIFADLLTRNDRQVIDGGIHAFCRFTIGSGRVVSFVQSGLLRYNFMVMLVVLILLGLYFLLSLGAIP
jgi:NADH-quinone oxidoreductase subunit L